MIAFHVSAARRFAKDFSINHILISSVYFDPDSWLQLGVHMMLCGVGIFFPPFVSGMCNQEEHLVGVFFLPNPDYCMTQLGGLPMMKNASGIHGWWSEW